MTSPSFRHMRRLIYALKRRWGQPVSICRTTNAVLDVETGIQSSDLTKVDVKRAILLPMSALRSFAYDLSFIAANKNFTYGGFFDLNTRIVLLSRRDVPTTFTFDQNVYLIVKGSRMEVKKPTYYEDDECIAFLAVGLHNQPQLNQFVEEVSDDLNIDEGGVDS